MSEDVLLASLTSSSLATGRNILKTPEETTPPVQTPQEAAALKQTRNAQKEEKSISSTLDQNNNAIEVDAPNSKLPSSSRDFKKFNAYLQDAREMRNYLKEINLEIQEFQEEYDTRGMVLAMARKRISAPHLSRAAQELKKDEESPEETVRRLYTNFEKIVEKMKKEKLDEKGLLAENAKLKEKLRKMSALKAEKTRLDENMRGDFAKEKTVLEKINKKAERVNELANKLKPIPLL